MKITFAATSAGALSVSLVIGLIGHAGCGPNPRVPNDAAADGARPVADGGRRDSSGTSPDTGTRDAVADRIADASTRPDARDGHMDATFDRAVGPRDSAPDGLRSRGDAGTDAGQRGGRDGGADASAGTTCASATNDVWTPVTVTSAVQKVWAFGPGDVVGYGTDLRLWNGVVWKLFPTQPPFIPVATTNSGIVGGTSDNDIWLIDSFSGNGITRWDARDGRTSRPPGWVAKSGPLGVAAE